MKIAMLTTVHRHDDIRIYQKEARTLAAAGHRVYVVNPEYDGEDENGIRFVKIPAPKRRAGRILFGWRAAARAAKELGAGCCHLHDPELLFAVPELRRAGMRVVYDAHEDLPRQILAKRWIWRPFRKAVSALAERAEDHFAARCDAVIGATETIAARFPRSLAVRNLPDGEDAGRFAAAARSSPCRRRAVCYAGALTEQRGLFRMIEACRLSNAALLLAGEFESEALRARAERSPGWAEHVEYLGRLDRPGVARMYAEASAAFLLLDDTPAYRQSLPIKLFEYLMAGLPVVATDFPLWRALSEGGAARFVPAGNVSAAAAALDEVLSNPDWKRRAREGAAALSEKLSFDRERDRLLALYESLAARAEIGAP